MKRRDRNGRSEEARLDQLVFECLERMEIEGDEALVELCARHPDHADYLRTRLESLRTAGLIRTTGRKRGPALPERIGGLRLMERLGADLLGVLYRAEDRERDQRVALRVFKVSALAGPEQAERLVSDARSAQKLQFPGIVPVRDAGRQEGFVYVTVDLVDAVRLSDVVRELAGHEAGRLTGMDLRSILGQLLGRDEAPSEEAIERFSGNWVSAVTRIGAQAAEALSYAHARGVLHSTVRLESLWMDLEGRVFLADFGLAAAGVQRPGADVLLHQPPEQLLGDAVGAEARGDVYALGVALYELLTLRPPYEGRDRDKLLRRIATGGFRRLRELNPAVPPDLETVISTAMDPNADRRYASAEALARDLNNAAERRAIDARPSSSVLRLQRYARRNPLLVLGGAVTLAVLAWGPYRYGLSQHNARVAIAQERGRSEQSLRRALDAMHTLTARVYEENWTDEEPDAAQRRSLQEALAYYRDFLGDRLLDSAYRRDVALAMRNIGELHMRLGNFEAAERSLVQARGFAAEGLDANHRAAIRLGLARLFARDGRDAEALQELEQGAAVLEEARAAGPLTEPARRVAARVQEQRADLLLAKGQLDAGEAALREAARILSELVDEDAADRDEHERLVRALTMVTRLRLRAGDVAQVGAVARLALGRASRMLERWPAERGVQRQALLTFELAAGIAQESGDEDPAKQLFERAVEVGEQAARGGVERSVHEALARAYKNLGDISQRNRDQAGMGRALRRRAELFVALWEADPSVTKRRAQVVGAELELARFVMWQGDLTEATELLTRAHARIEEALAVGADRALSALQHDVLEALSETFVRDGRCVEAVQAATRLADLGAWGKLPVVANHVRVCIGRLTEGEDVSPRQAEQAERWAGRAVRLLRLALEHGALRGELVAPGTEWDSLEAYEVFRTLRLELGQG